MEVGLGWGWVASLAPDVLWDMESWPLIVLRQLQSAREAGLLVQGAGEHDASWRPAARPPASAPPKRATRSPPSGPDRPPGRQRPMAAAYRPIAAGSCSPVLAGADGVMLSAASKRICWSGRGRSPFQTTAAVAVSG